IKFLSPGSVEYVGRQLVAGRGLTGQTTCTGCRIGIVNQEAVDLYLGGNAVGAAVIDEQGRRTDIIGVVHSGPLGAFQRRVQPTLYLPMAQDVLTSMSMIVQLREVACGAGPT